MREIKFKFWNKRNNRWENDPLATIQTHYQNPFGNSELVPCQYTGLKDKNEKEIYDGDIIEFREVAGIGSGFGCIGFYNFGWQMYFAIHKDNYINKDNWESLYNFESPEMEIISNVYEHPNLLEEKLDDK
jgi:uncharacterized phage protein (TIGR01671 family)